MGNCSVCGKELGMFEGYETLDKEYCDDCFKKRGEHPKNKEIVEKNEEKLSYQEQLAKNELERRNILSKNLKAARWIIGIAVLIYLIYFFCLVIFDS